MVNKAAKTAGDAAKHPASIWGAILLTLIPALVDRYVTRPGKEAQESQIQQAQWVELNAALVRLQKATDERWEKGRDSVGQLAVQVAKLETALSLLTSGRRREAQRTIIEPPEEAPKTDWFPDGPFTHTNLQITLPPFEEVRKRALE